jgi:N-acetylglucosamine malate deacetylase 2
MKILYIFPHPDDESFGPAHAMAKQRREGHEVYLLTLTKGGATKQRHKFGYSIEEMGEVRYREMLDVAKTLDLTDLTVLDLPDSGLKEMDPREIESAIRLHIEKFKPEVVVTYAVHGVSGFHDHLISHAVVKSAFAEMKEMLGYPKRLALFTVTAEDAAKQTHFKLNSSTDDEIDCIIETNEYDIQKAVKCLECYVSYGDIIKSTNIHQHLNKNVVFEIYREKHDPKLKDLFEKI